MPSLANWKTTSSDFSFLSQDAKDWLIIFVLKPEIHKIDSGPPEVWDDYNISHFKLQDYFKNIFKKCFGINRLFKSRYDLRK